MSSQKAKMFVIPAKAVGHNPLKKPDSRFCRNDEDPSFSPCYEAVKVAFIRVDSKNKETAEHADYIKRLSEL